LAVAVFVTGGTVALANYLDTSGADGAVRGYFAALQRGDAAAALGFGDIPDGPRTLLTSTVLHEQKRIAPIRDVTITRTASESNQATVGVHYVLAFPDGPQSVDDSVAVYKRDGSWRLSHAAVATRLNLLGASERATIVGAPLPTDVVLVFPGAAPIRLDTGALALDTDTAVVRMDTHDGADTSIVVVATDAGMTMVRNAVAGPTEINTRSFRNDRESLSRDSRRANGDSSILIRAVPRHSRGLVDLPGLSVHVAVFILCSN